MADIIYCWIWNICFLVLLFTCLKKQSTFTFLFKCKCCFLQQSFSLSLWDSPQINCALRNTLQQTCGKCHYHRNLRVPCRRKPQHENSQESLSPIDPLGQLQRIVVRQKVHRCRDLNKVIYVLGNDNVKNVGRCVKVSGLMTRISGSLAAYLLRNEP